MREIQQDPKYHAEGNVYIHTRMVCEALVSNRVFHQLPAGRKTEIFLAALLHDLGKVKTTRKEDGAWVSPHHSVTGSQMVREFLWKKGGLCGTAETIRFRETVCALIRNHMRPLHLMNQDQPEREARRIASAGKLISDFSWELLLMLSEADMKGRIAADRQEGMMQIQLSAMTAAESGCLNGPYAFRNENTAYAYLNGKNVQPDQDLYDDTWGEVILLSGLPGTGKDYWIHHQGPDLPAVSLDKIRNELQVSPAEEQGVVVQTAQERVKELLRKKQPLILNATNLTKDTRQKWIRLFENYKASCRIVYLETERTQQQERNRNRNEAAVVPEQIVERMLSRLSPPMPEEARRVEWICV